MHLICLLVGLASSSSAWASNWSTSATKNVSCSSIRPLRSVGGVPQAFSLLYLLIDMSHWVLQMSVVGILLLVEGRHTKLLMRERLVLST